MNYGYIRVSTTEQVEGTSLETQRRQILGNAMTHDLTIDHWIEDAGISGAMKFFDRLAAHGVELQPGDTIVVAKLDRFSRDAADALSSIETMRENKVALIINGHGDVMDETNLSGRLMLEVMAVFSGHERRTLKERQRVGQKAKRAAGGHIGGSAPFGYVVAGNGKAAKLVEDAEEQNIIVRINELAQQQVSLRKIQGVLRSESLRSPSLSVISRIIKDAA
jgi:DNA invertase Pin-like site-specific DNA recombinase|tara:strand:- start:622 stop:1284 length:663 start_codon:yes stop_codon:yes gene_type:complete